MSDIPSCLTTPQWPVMTRAMIEKLRVGALQRDAADWIESQAQDIKVLLAEIERLRADAERYRLLRTGQHWPAAFIDHYSPEPVVNEELDEMLDAIRKEQKE